MTSFHKNEEITLSFFLRRVKDVCKKSCLTGAVDGDRSSYFLTLLLILNQTEEVFVKLIIFQELLESVGGGGGVGGEANRRRPLQLKASRLGHTGKILGQIPLFPFMISKVSIVSNYPEKTVHRNPKNIISLLKGGLQCEKGGVEERLHGKDNLGEEAAGGGARGRAGGACGEEGRRGRSALEQLQDRQVFTF